MSIHVIYESPVGNFRVVQKDTTGYYYPQKYEKALLSPSMVWRYLYIGTEYKEDDVISEASPELARRYEQCIR